MPVFTPFKKPASTDWHRAYIIYRLRLKDMSLRRLSVLNGYAPRTLGGALDTPYLPGQNIIADFLGVPPQEIWPSRYNADGSPIRIRRIYRVSRNFSTGSQRSVIQRQRVG